MEITKNYPGSQINLYLVSGIIVGNVRKRLVTFSQFKGLYTDPYLQALESEIRSCMELPDDAMRTFGHEQVRNELVIDAGKALKRCRSLKRYIATAFPNDMDTYMNSLGWSERYEKAANQSWTDVTALCNSCEQFIEANAEALSANNNMPETFPELFSADYLRYSQKLTLFENRKTAAKTGGETKISANNALHTKIIECCLDGQHLFEDAGDAVKSEYSFEAMSALISPGGPSGMSVEPVKDVDGVMVPMVGVEVSIVGTDLRELTNGEGKADFIRLTEGPKKVRIVADGFEERLIDVTLDGTMKRLKVVMIPLFSEEMKAQTPGGEQPVSNEQPSENVQQ